MDFLSVHPREVAQLTGAGGERFTEFCNALIREMARAAGIASAAISDMLKVNVADGGVDTHVNTGSATDESGYLATASCWQFKATAASTLTDAKLEEELEKQNAKGELRYVAELIKAGAAYTFCIADEITSDKKNDIVKVLEAAKNEINPAAPPVRVLAAGDLAAQAERFPALVVRFFRHGPSLLHMEAWGANATSETPVYVLVQDWAVVRASIENHIDFATSVHEPAYVVSADPGIGKTRLVYETLKAAGAGSLVLYTSDEDAAATIATILANDGRLYAILVVDDCSLETKHRVNTTLRGHSSRVRAVVIEPYGERIAADSDPKLEEMPDAALDEVLAANFAGVAKDRREAYRKLAGGYVRFAIALCRDDALILASGVHAGLASVDEYLRLRITDPDEQDALQAMSLVVRIGFSEDVRDELRMLCELLDLDANKVRQAASRSKDRPGFITRAGRFLYISPEIIANAAFRAAWRRWVADDPSHFLGRVPQPLLRTFLKRIERSADQESRDVVGKFFFSYIAALDPSALADAATAQLFATLVSAQPSRYVPLLRQKIEEADTPAALGITGEYRGSQPPRRTFVWLAERLIAFPEFFHDAERILLKLALNESEPGIGNNATALWAQLYRIFLSGTATPFAERIALLRQRLLSGDEAQARLAARALAGIFNPWPSRMGVDIVFADRISPEEWRPVTYGDLNDCYASAVTVLRDMINSGQHALRALAQEIVVAEAWFFLTHNLFDELVDLVRLLDLDEPNRKTLYGRAMELVLRTEYRETGDETKPENLDAIRRWAESLVPETLHGRIARFLATRGALALTQGESSPIVEALADDLSNQEDALGSELAELVATSDYVGDLGFAVGKRDADANHAEQIIAAGTRQPNTFVRGYISGLVNTWPEHAELVNKLLDSTPDAAPTSIIDLAMAGGRRTRVLERTLTYVRAGEVPAATLGALRYGIAGEELRPDEIAEMLHAMLAAPDAPKTGGPAAALSTLGYLVGYKKHAELLDRTDIQQTAWQTIEEFQIDERDALPHDWAAVVRALATFDHRRAIRGAIRVLLTTGFYAKDQAQGVLTDFAQKHPTDVMELFGAALLDPGDNIAPLINTYTPLITAIGFDVVRAWLQQHGLAGARAVARHLPSPFLDTEGAPQVPPITEFVLREFEEDDRVYEAFYSGTHNMRFYSGDIARHHEAEAAVAECFLAHPLRRIREWAQDEREGALHKAAWFRRRSEEELVE